MGPRFSTNEADLDEVAGDFGRLAVHRPKVVVRVSCVEDVVEALEFARARDLRVVARGQGHSTRGQASLTGGLVLDLGALDAVDVAGGEGVVGAGARWCDVLAETLKYGLTPPTLTDYLRLSVGGTLSVGGVGGQSFRYGLQTDQVSTLTVVTGTGEVVTCSDSVHPQLFDACRAGLGQCGIIVGARLRLIQAPPAVRVLHLKYRDLSAWLEDQTALATEGRFDYLLGSILPDRNSWCYRLEATRYLFEGDYQRDDALGDLRFDASEGVECRTCSFTEYANRLEAMELEMKSAGTWQARHPWMDLFVPASALQGVIENALSVFTPEQLLDSHTLTYPLDPEICRTPLSAVPRQERSFLFGVGPNIGLADAAGLQRFERGCQSACDLAFELGAGVYPIGYPVGAVATTPARWSKHFFSRSLFDAKKRYDPEERLRALHGVQ